MRPKDRVLVLLDSDHTKQHVLKELELYSELVPSGDYLLVNDTNMAKYFSETEQEAPAGGPRVPGDPSQFQGGPLPRSV